MGSTTIENLVDLEIEIVEVSLEAETEIVAVSGTGLGSSNYSVVAPYLQIFGGTPDSNHVAMPPYDGGNPDSTYSVSQNYKNEI